MIQIYEDLPDDIKYKYNSKWVISNNLKDRIHDEHLDMIKIPGYDIKYFFGHKIEYIDSEEEIIRFLTLEQERDEKLNELLK